MLLRGEGRSLGRGGRGGVCGGVVCHLIFVRENYLYKHAIMSAHLHVMNVASASGAIAAAARMHRLSFRHLSAVAFQIG